MIEKPWDMSPEAREEFLKMWKVDPVGHPYYMIQRKYVSAKGYLVTLAVLIAFAAIMTYFDSLAGIIMIVPILLIGAVSWRIILSLIKINLYMVHEPYLAYGSDSIFQVTCCYLKDEGFDVWIPTF